MPAGHPQPARSYGQGGELVKASATDMTPTVQDNLDEETCQSQQDKLLPTAFLVLVAGTCTRVPNAASRRHHGRCVGRLFASSDLPAAAHDGPASSTAGVSRVKENEGAAVREDELGQGRMNEQDMRGYTRGEQVQEREG